MEKLFKPELLGEGETSLTVSESTSALVKTEHFVSPTSKEFVDLNRLPSDPAFRKDISFYHPNQADDIRRHYLISGPCQPRNHDFPQKMIGNKLRRFNRDWFDEYSDWLEYSIAENRAYCLCCYLFSNQSNNQGFGAFISKGFSSWHKKDRFDAHIGGVNSAHYIALKKCEDLLRPEQFAAIDFHKQSDIVRNEIRIQLCAAVDACRFLLNQGLCFRDHDESEHSLNKGNFLELVELIAKQNYSVRNDALVNVKRKMCQMISHTIDKDIVHCFAQEIVKKIIEEFTDDYFSLMVDESSDVNEEEQIVVVLRFVDACGNVKERFICVVHVTEISALFLKSAIDSVFANLNLSLIKVRGQTYDGESNMRDEFSGLKTSIMKENQSAYYVHCFAHQIQLAMVALAKNNVDIAVFFNMISILIKVIGASCKCNDMIRQRQVEIVLEGIKSGLAETEMELDQELGLTMVVETRWESHIKSLLNLVAMFSSIIEVLEVVSCDATDSLQQVRACDLLDYLQSFDFVFHLQLMLSLLLITNELSLALQRKDRDILNATTLVRISRERLQVTRNDGWESLLEKVIDFCNKNKIDCLDMNDEYVNRYRPRCKTHVTNEFHYRVECFNAIMDQQILEIDDQFNEVNSELLRCVASLNPSDGFVEFSTTKVIRLAQFYPDDFSSIESLSLEGQLETYIMDVRLDDRFSQLEGLADLYLLLVKTRKHLLYPLVHRLLKFALILPVATPSVERFSPATMHIVKTFLRNHVCDQFLNDRLVCLIEKDLLKSITNDVVIERLHMM